MHIHTPSPYITGSFITGLRPASLALGTIGLLGEVIFLTFPVGQTLNKWNITLIRSIQSIAAGMFLINASFRLRTRLHPFLLVSGAVIAMNPILSELLILWKSRRSNAQSEANLTVDYQSIFSSRVRAYSDFMRRLVKVICAVMFLSESLYQTSQTGNSLLNSSYHISLSVGYTLFCFTSILYSFAKDGLETVLKELNTGKKEIEIGLM